jgi:hypothetical protein
MSALIDIAIGAAALVPPIGALDIWLTLKTRRERDVDPSRQGDAKPDGRRRLQAPCR